MFKNATKNKHHASREDYDLYGDLERIRNAFSDTASHAKDEASKLLAESLENVKENLKERSADIREKITDRISEKPYQMIGYVMLFSLVAGYLLRARRK